MFGLTSLGVVHTAVSLIAVGAGIVAFIRYKKIAPDTSVGKIYIVTTLITVLTGFGIFQHGGFGKPHALGVITLIVLGIAVLAGRTNMFGRAKSYVETISYSATFLFHMIPGVTETSTRLPPGAPLVASPEAPELQVTTGVLFLLFLFGVALQVLSTRKAGRLAG